VAPAAWHVAAAFVLVSHTGSPAGQLHEKLYRLGSVGQDTSLCLWDLVMEEDPAYVNINTGQTGGLK
jgi:hypothetical protein